MGAPSRENLVDPDGAMSAIPAEAGRFVAEQPQASRASTRDLVARARHGHADAYLMLFERFHGEVYRFATRRTGDHWVGQEIAADTLADAFAGIHRFRWQGAPFEAWLYTIARRRIADHHRARAKAPAPVAPPVDHGDIAARIADVDLVRRLVEMLPPAEREVIELRFMEGLDVRQTARRLRKRTGAVRIAQMRALDRLRGLIGGEDVG